MTDLRASVTELNTEDKSTAKIVVEPAQEKSEDECTEKAWVPIPTPVVPTVSEDESTEKPWVPIPNVVFGSWPSDYFHEKCYRCVQLHQCFSYRQLNDATMFLTYFLVGEDVRTRCYCDECLEAVKSIPCVHIGKIERIVYKTA